MFSAWSSAVDNSLWRIDVSGKSAPQRIAPLGNNVCNPTISLRGHRLGYVRILSDDNIWRLEIPAPGGEPHPPAKFIFSTRMEHHPQFSPDGKKIAFASDRSGTHEIWVCDSDGSNLFQLTYLGQGALQSVPHWSPDGRRLTFSSALEGHPEVYVIDADGRHQRRLTSNPMYSDNPSWSSDGRWILFDTWVGSRQSQILKVSPEGGPAVGVFPPGPDWGPVESPDGRFIYTFVGSPDGDSNTLMRRTAEGGEAQKVLDHLSPLFDYALVRDGIYFAPEADAKSGYSIQFLNTATGTIRRVASLEKPIFGLTVSPDRRWLLYTQEDQAGSDLMLVENFH